MFLFSLPSLSLSLHFHSFGSLYSDDEVYVNDFGYYEYEDVSNRLSITDFVFVFFIVIALHGDVSVKKKSSLNGVECLRLYLLGPERLILPTQCFESQISFPIFRVEK